MVQSPRLRKPRRHHQPTAHSTAGLSTQAARVPLGVEKVLDTSSYLFPTGKDIQEEESVSQALRDVPGAWRRWVT